MADVRLSRGLLPRADAIGAASFLPGGMAVHLKLVVASAEGAERGIGGSGTASLSTNSRAFCSFISPMTLPSRCSGDRLTSCDRTRGVPPWDLTRPASDYSGPPRCGRSRAR